MLQKKTHILSLKKCPYNWNKTSHIKILYEKFVENIQVHYIKLKKKKFISAKFREKCGFLKKIVKKFQKN